MHNRIFGDERDFYKYALLRALAGCGLRIGVCWLLTESGSGCGCTDYLRDKKGCLARMDKKLLCFLRRRVCEEGIRNVNLLQEHKIIRSAQYFADAFPLQADRREYFEAMSTALKDADLLFFDPNTGMLPDNPANPDEYIGFDEIGDCWRKCQDSSLMVFQYFHPASHSEQRQKWHKKICLKLKKAAPGAKICVVWKKPVAYYFAVREQHDELPGQIGAAAKKAGMEVVIP